MILALFCISSVILGALLNLFFRRFSWTYLLVSIVLAAAAWLGAGFALGEIRPFPPTVEYITALLAWDLIPWFLFAFVPVQAGYFAAMLLRWRFSSRTTPHDPPRVDKII